MKKKSEDKVKILTTWYLEPGNPESNNALLSLPQFSADSDLVPNVTVQPFDKLPRKANLVRCPDYNLIKIIQNAMATNSSYKFKLFSKQGKNGPIKQTPFLSSLKKDKKTPIRLALTQVPKSAKVN